MVKRPRKKINNTNNYYTDLDKIENALKMAVPPTASLGGHRDVKFELYTPHGD